MLRIPPGLGIIRDSSPPSVAIAPFHALVEPNRYPVTLLRTPPERHQPLATFACRKKSAGIGLRNFHTKLIGRSPLCET